MTVGLAFSVGPFAVPTNAAVLLICGLVAAGVGHWAGRRQKVGIGGTLVDMLLAAGLAARIAFIAVWFDHYRSAPWSILDIRDGGFTPWAGAMAAALVAVWQASRRAVLRKPLMFGLMAGVLVWGATIGVLHLGAEPDLADSEAMRFATLKGERISLAGLAAGKPMVVNLWASWCPPCRHEMPVLAAAQKQLQGVVFVFANQGEDVATIERYLNADELIIGNVLLDPDGALARKFGSVALPTTLFFASNGRLADTHLGALSSATLASKLAQLR